MACQFYCSLRGYSAEGGYISVCVAVFESDAITFSLSWQTYSSRTNVTGNLNIAKQFNENYHFNCFGDRLRTLFVNINKCTLALVARYSYVWYNEKGVRGMLINQVDLRCTNVTDYITLVPRYER